MNNLKAALCRERGMFETPVIVPRHVSTPLAICEEITDFDTRRIPKEIIDVVIKNGYVIIDDAAMVEKMFGLSLKEGEYLKIYLID